MYSQLFTLLVACLLKAGDVKGAYWPSTPGATHPGVMYECAGKQLKILWQYELDTTAGEQAEDIRWYFEKGSSRSLIAVWADSAFLAMPAFHSRVEQYSNAGLIMNNVTVADSGNYSVVINTYNDASEFATLQKSTIVQIGDTLMTQDGHLHVSQKAEAVLDTATDQWAIQLQCGTFTYLAEPPFQVEWTTPSSVQVRVSSNYNDNHFNLLLPSPVTGGNYTCRIPSHDADEACLRPGETDKAHAMFYVDKVLARLLLLESENKQLKEKLDQFNSTCP